MESIWKGSKVLQCELVSKGHLVCDDGEKWVVDEYGSLSAAEETTYALICVGLVLFAGLMSGLTLGLLSLDPIHLEIWRNSSDARRKESAEKVIPLLKSRHHVLVTLLVCNAAAMEALPIFLDRIVSAPWIAIVISVSAVLMFGEIIPQAVCSRYGLIIGAQSVLIVKFLMILTGIFTWPIGKLLDLILGKEDHFFEREELKELVTIHTGPANLSVDEVTIIRGALDMKSKTVSDAMTPIDKVFMLEANIRLSKAVMQEITKKGHSRIPVYSQKKNKILGQLLVKTLINVDPDANTRVADVPLRDLPSVSHNVPLYDVLNEFQTGKSHMALVCNEQYHVIGIITLEDIIEELIQEEIADETDQPTTPGPWRKSQLDKIKVTVEPSGGGQASQEYTPLIRHYGSTNQ